MRLSFAAALVAVSLFAAALTASAQQTSPSTAPSSTSAALPAETAARIAAIAQKVLEDSGVPSASVGIVQDGRIVYTQAFGRARVTPKLQAEASMAYPIGSISKQFTAAAMLLLQQQGKLCLEDPVSRFFPELTDAKDVRIINLLTHTSGYQDYAPQDYTIPAWKHPGDPLKIVHAFAGKPLDFVPGTQWQYSNTNFVLAALIVEKVSGEPFARFLEDQILKPAGLSGVLNLNREQSRLQVTGYMRYALAPISPAALEAPGWYFGDADLAMPASQLLKWDLTLINQSLLSPASYREMETPFFLADGKDSHYGLGIEIREEDGRRVLEHSGEVGGFVAEDVIYPDDHAAVVVLTNQEASEAAGQIAGQIAPLILPAKTSTAKPANPAMAAAEAFAPHLQTVLAGLQQGQIDRTLFTADCNDYFDATAIGDYRSSLAPLGSLTAVATAGAELRGGMTFGIYRAAFSGGTTALITVYLEPDGRIEQLLVVGKAAK